MFGLFGRGMELGAFHLAWALPNTFRRLVGEGALTAAFVPVLTRRLDEGGVEEARRAFGAVLGGLLLVLVGILTLGWAALTLLPESWLLSGQSAGPAYATLLRTLLLLLLPYLLPISLLTLAAAAQNVTGRFALPAAAPLLLNVVWIAAVLVSAGIAADLSTKAILIGGLLLVGGFLQLALQLPGLARSGLLARPSFGFRDPDLLEVGRNMLPMVLGLSVIQLNTLATHVLAAFLVDSGAPSILFLANRMLEFPHALLGIALGTAVFPLLSLLGGRGDTEGLRSALDRALSLGLFLAIPATVGLFLLAPRVIDVLFVTGRFTAPSGDETTRVLRILCFALPGLIGVQILARAHYALGDTRTPVRVALLFFGLAQVLNVLLAPRFGTAGLACSSVFGATGSGAMLLWSLARAGRLPPASGRVPAAAVRAAVASMPMAGVAFGGAELLAGAFEGSGFLIRLVFVLLLPIGSAICAFLAVARWMGADEAREITAAWRKRSKSP